MKLWGYARVSTTDQNPELQIDALIEAGVPRKNIFIDKVSGTKWGKDRPEMDRLFMTMKRGDTFLVWKLDRIGRSVGGVIDTLQTLNNAGVRFKVITQPAMETVTPMGKLLIHILAAFAELERDLIRERTKAGIQAAKARGTTLGRPVTVTNEQVLEVVKSHKTARGAAERLGLSVGGLRKRLKAMGYWRTELEA